VELTAEDAKIVEETVESDDVVTSEEDKRIIEEVVEAG